MSERNEGFGSESTDGKNESLLLRSWHAVLSPFSSTALSKLPDTSKRNRDREPRADRIPETREGESGVEQVQSQSAAGVYRATGTVTVEGEDTPIQVRVPRKIATAIKVEGKVWFANERTWVSYVNVGILIGTLSLALFNASKDEVSRLFAYIYALISIGVLIYGSVVYQRRITMIRRRDPGHFDQIVGPVLIAACLFFAVLANFILRVKGLKFRGAPVPGF